MRRKSSIEKQVWFIKHLLVNTEENTMEHAVRQGLLMGMQWCLGTKFDDKGNVLNGVACGELVVKRT